MTDLIDKVERRLGTKPLNLPPDIRKDKWAKNCIIPDSITTFSRYFPNKITIPLDNTKQKNGYCLIDEQICESMDILGIRDINWDQFSRVSPTMQLGGMYGYFDSFTTDYSMDDVGLLQMRADLTSAFSVGNGIYIDFKPPNMVKFVSVNSCDILKGISVVPIDILIKHSDNLMTISPTKMEIFEKLAIADVASYLFEYLKYYDGLETVFANVDLKLSTLESRAGERADVVQTLQDSYVSASNENQPLMFTV
jgi:hypothetical protein